MYYCCVSIQALHPSEAFEGKLCHNATRSLFQSEDSLFLEDAALRSFMASHVPRFFAGLKKTKEKEKMATLHCIDRDVRVKHLVTQPGNAPKARPSHLTAADEVNKVSEGLAFTDHKDRVLQRTQTWTETQQIYTHTTYTTDIYSWTDTTSYFVQLRIIFKATCRNSFGLWNQQ